MSDIRFALRSLSKARPFTLATFLTLSLCIGANATLFGIVYPVLLKPLAVPQPDRLVRVINGYPKSGLPRAGAGVPDHFDRVDGMRTVESLALYSYRTATTGEPGRPERLGVMHVTPSYFRVAGVRPVIGRAFLEQEGEPDSDDRAILSFRYWQERYGGDVRLVGQTIRIDGRAHTVVGVMPADFEVVEPAEARVWVPLAITPAQRSDRNRHNNSWNSIGRLRDGADVAQAQAEVDRINAGVVDRLPEWRAMAHDSGFRTEVLPLQEDLVRDVKGRLYFLWGATLLVLLIGCANVVNLALVRSHGRRRDLATRVALGAGRLALVRHVLAEGLLLALASGLAGLLVGWGGLRAVSRFDLRQIPRAQHLGLDAATVCFTLALCLVIGALIGLVPLAAAGGGNLASVFHDGGRAASSGRARLLRRTLVVAQVAVAFTLLVAAGLLVSSFRQVAAIAPGFDSTHVLTATVSLPVGRYVVRTADPDLPDLTRLHRFNEITLARLRATPGLVNAGITSSLPLTGGSSTNPVTAEGHVPEAGEAPMTAMRVHVTPGYLETLRVPLLRGRPFDAGDAATAPRVVIVDTRLAERLWPGQDPIGRRMCEGTPGGAATRWATVVGLAGEVKQIGLVADRPVGGVYYYPVSQRAALSLTFVVRTVAEPAAMAGALRQAVAHADPELPVYRVRTFEEVTSDSLLMRRWPMLVTTAFGGVALLLAAIGLFGVLAYLVTLRTREIGIRMALGGTPSAILGLVAGEGLVLLLAGLAGGVLGVAALQRTLASQLHGVQPADPAVLAAAAAILGAVGVVACAVPARRATRIDPVLALTVE